MDKDTANPTRRQFLKLISTGAAALFTSSCTNSFQGSGGNPSSQPNIVWIIADDLSPDLGCYGNKIIKTPNIDRLARQGMRFTNAFSTGAVCSPARSAFYTGMYQTTIGAHQHRTSQASRTRLPKDVNVITEYFRRTGYFTCNGDGTVDSEPGKTDFNFKTDRKTFDGTDWSQRKPDQPFFAHVQIYDPHRPFKRDTQNPIEAGNLKLPPYYPDHPLSRRDWANYLEAVQILDRTVGKVLTRLDNEGLADNTIVIFFADQGRPQLRAKQWLYDSGIKVPLIVRWPDRLKPGSINNDLVSLIDVSATSLHLAGLKVPENMQGRAFLGKAKTKRDHIFAARDRCDLISDRIRCVRTKRFKYIRNFHPDRDYTNFGYYKEFYYPTLALMKVLDKKGRLTPAQKAVIAPKRPPEELYDLRNDPFEINNLAADANFAGPLNNLRTKLDQWLKQTNDQGNFPEPQQEIDSWRKPRKEKYAKKWAERGLPINPNPQDYLNWWEKQLISNP